MPRPPLHPHVIRSAIAVAGLTTALALRPESGRVVQAAGLHAGAPHAPIVRSLVISDQARRYLVLQNRALTSTEFLGCMIGDIRGSTVLVQRIAPADVEPEQSSATHVMPKRSCEDAGWTGTVGMIHSHPSGERCWYLFPGTQVASSDGQSFARQPYAVDAILCGDHVVWIRRDMTEGRVSLATAGDHGGPVPAGR